ncbi:hypothetical protein PLESTF_001430500 [Pleodorina starrii]|nr:hypothetical protein PLESTF_001430500 [Pleodorina starrii]
MVTGCLQPSRLRRLWHLQRLILLLAIWQHFKQAAWRVDAQTANSIDTNVAIGKQVYSSSCLDISRYAPEKAVDGLAPAVDDSSVFISGGVGLPLNNTTPWLSIDLGETMLVSRVVYHNRKDCCANLTRAPLEFRAGGAAVVANNGSAMRFNDLIYTASANDNQTISVVSIEMNMTKPARYISVQSTAAADESADDSGLQVLELEVYGSPADSFVMTWDWSSDTALDGSDHSVPQCSAGLPAVRPRSVLIE